MTVVSLACDICLVLLNIAIIERLHLEMYTLYICNENTFKIKVKIEQDKLGLNPVLPVHTVCLKISVGLKYYTLVKLAPALSQVKDNMEYTSSPTIKQNVFLMEHSANCMKLGY